MTDIYEESTYSGSGLRMPKTTQVGGRGRERGGRGEGEGEIMMACREVESGVLGDEESGEG